MPPIRPKEHVWTEFELHTMLCLITRGVHLEQRPNKRTEERSITRVNAYENFYTALNNAVHGKDFNSDIHKKEVTRMLDQMLGDRKHVVGRGGLVERMPIGRITRSLRQAWSRSKCSYFDGSLSEWNQGRKEKVMMQYKIARGLIAAPVEGPGEKRDVVMTGNDGIAQINSVQYITPAAVNSTGRSRWRNERDHAPAFQTPSLTRTNLDSLRTLPESMRSTGKFDWAITPGATRDYAHSEISTANRPLKRAGLHTRDLSRPREYESSVRVYQADRMRLSYEEYRSSKSSGYRHSASRDVDSRDHYSTSNKHYSSTPHFGNGYSTPKDITPQVATPASYHSNKVHVHSSAELSVQAYHELKVTSPKNHERDLAGKLNQDVDMMDDLEAHLTAAMESQYPDHMMA